jgi:pyruvate kinase
MSASVFVAVKKTKIVCTLGPASSTPEVLDALIASGMDVARLNFSHGSHEDHRATYRKVREAALRAGREICILQDLQGPKIRVGLLDGGKMELTSGQELDIVAADEQPEPGVIPTTYDAFASDVSVDDCVLMDDGLMRMRVIGVRDGRVRCKVEVGGTLKNRKGINLPGVEVSAPALTEKDLADLDFGVELEVDFVCLSFVRTPADIELAKSRLRAKGRGTVPVIAKIEKPEAVDNLGAILDAADGIMVARGDLGVEMGPAKVPLIQKRCIEEANRRGKLVITATQMLESMVTASFPTRAEASDVANAVLDQTDAVMLSAETATGKHPPLAVDTMRAIIEEIEGSERYRQLAELPPLDLGVSANAIAHAAAAASDTLSDVSAVVCISSHGIAPTLLSDYRPNAPIYALTGEPEHCRRLAAFWGVVPIQFSIEKDDTAESVIARAEALLVERKIISVGDRIVLTLAVPPAQGLHTNTLKVHRAGSSGSEIPTDD